MFLTPMTMSKYGNSRTRCCQSHTHDSKVEATYCDHLYLLTKAGEVIKYEVAPKIILQEKFRGQDGKMVRAITYSPDFIVYWDGGTEFVDVKGGNGTQTTSWKIKWKMLQHMYHNEPTGAYRFTVAE